MSGCRSVGSTRRPPFAMIVAAFMAALLISRANAFAPILRREARRHVSSSVQIAAAMMMDVPPAVVVMMPLPATAVSSSPQVTTVLTTSSTPLQDGVQSYMMMSRNNMKHDAAATSNSLMVSLQERKVPTAEEIAQKKLNFNLIFWGGGFVAPFLATVFYFGTRFWEK